MDFPSVLQLMLSEPGAQRANESKVPNSLLAIRNLNLGHQCVQVLMQACTSLYLDLLTAL